MKRAFLMTSVVAAALAAAGCRVSETNENGTTAQSSEQHSDWAGFVNNFIEADFKANPGFAVGQGRHEYDGQVADLTEAGISAEVARLKKAIADARSRS